MIYDCDTTARPPDYDCAATRLRLRDLRDALAASCFSDKVDDESLDGRATRLTNR